MPAGRSTERSLRNSETQRDIDAANTLISPPPEEMLRATRTRTPSRYSATPEPSHSNGPSTEALSRTPTASKRKRLVSSASSSQSTLAGTDHDQHEKSNPLASVENTPNPKSRKQVKRSVVFASSSSRNPSQAPTTPTKSSTRGSKSPSKSPSKRALTRSPGQANPLANYIEGTRVERRRRSATPVIIPYEPPTDEFTPPREVMYTPVAKPQPKHSKSASRRKSSSPKKKLVMQIKQELPDDVDLNAPIPPPSPSDDPLLLRGPPGSGGSRKRTKSKKRDGAVQTQESQSVDRSSPIEEFFPHDNHPVENSPDVAPGENLESGPAGPFDFSAGGDDDDWTSDSDKEFDHVGELTGKYKIVTVPTKADPPSSATRQRQSMWGRPISPFPKVRRKSPILEEDEDEEMPESPSVGAQETDSATIFSTSTSRPTASLDDDVFVEGSSSGAIRPSHKSPSPLPQHNLARSPPAPSRTERHSTSPHNSPIQQQDTLNTITSGHITSPSKPSDSRFSFQDLDDLPPSEDEDEGLYAEYTVPIHDTSVDSVASLTEPLQEATARFSDHHSLQSPSPPLTHSHNAPRSPSPPSAQQPASPTPPSPKQPSPAPTHSPSPANSRQPTPAQDVPVSLPPVVLQPNERPRSPVVHMDLDDSEDDEDDEVSVFRELSQPPEMDSEDEGEGRNFLERSFAQVHLTSSPNPFSQSPAVRPQISRVQAAKEKLMASVEKSSPGYSPVELSLADNAGDDEGDSGELDVEPNVVKITSDDPLAAARAAAILRLHRYNSIDESTLRKRRHSNPAVDAILRSARKKVTSESGVTKTTPRRRHPLGRVVGNKVFIPGSPAMTLPELLDQEEVSLQIDDHSLHHSPLRSVSFASDFNTPVKQVIPSYDQFAPSPAPSVGPREWNKKDWKTLDACYTDERLALGERLELGVDELAPADNVELENVVERFIDIMGGDDALQQLGPSWTRDDLLRRARALQRKQRSGNYAAPTPSRQSSVFSTDSNFGRYLSPRPASISSDATACHRGSVGSLSSSPPPSVRYDKLIDEAVAVMNGERRDTSPGPRPPPTNIGSPSLASRMKGFIFSYLPRMSKPKPNPQSSVLGKGLPVPPPEVFNKPRPPITTPAPKPKPRPAHPKELVNLAPAPKPSMIPRPTKQYRRLVDLNHVTPPAPKAKPTVPVGRRDSGASVKDLVQSFEGRSREDISIERESLSRLGHRRVENWAGSRLPTQKATWKP